MDISILIATFKRPELLTHTLRSFSCLDTTGLGWEILVIDNAGDRATKEVVLKFSETTPVRYLRETKPGKNNALNAALSKAGGELLVFTDDDIVAARHWLIEMYEGARRWSHNSVFGGRILPKWPNDKPPSINHSFLLHAYTIADWDIPEGPCAAGYVYGPNMAIRRSVFSNGWKYNSDIGPKGDNYVTGGETDLTRRLEGAGLNAVYLPRALVFHQIRPEQLESQWLFKRAFRLGRNLAFREPSSKVAMLCGIPRWQIRRLCEEYLRFKLAMLCGDQKHQFEHGVSYWLTRGMIYQHRRQVVGEMTSPG